MSRGPSDNEWREIGFQDLQANPVGSKRDYQCLSEAPSGRWRDGSYDNTPSMGLTRDNAQKMEYRRGCQVGHSCLQQRLVVESRHDNSRGTKRPAPADFTDPTQVVWKGLTGEGLPWTAYASCMVGVVTAYFTEFLRFNSVKQVFTGRFISFTPSRAVELYSREAKS